MILVIDAYNVLKQWYGTHLRVQQITSFLIQLNRYSHSVSLKIVVVFDGYLPSEVNNRSYSYLELIEAGHKSSADEAIIHFVAHSDQPCVLISSDRTLKDQLKKELEGYVEPAYLIKCLKINKNTLHHVKNSNAHSIKTTSSTNEELDELMYNEGNLPNKKEEEIAEVRQCTAHSQSKKEKKQEKILLRLRKLSDI